MAVDLPQLESVLLGLSPKEYARRRPVVAAVEDDAYDKLTPTQKAHVDKQLELEANPRGALREIGTGFVRGGTVELPRMVGQALKATGQQGDTLYGIGQRLVEGADAREPAVAKDLTPGAHGAVVDAFTEGASMVLPSLAPLAAAPALAAVGVPGAAALGGAALAGGALFGGSQFQDTYEKAIKAGKTPDEARALGLQTGAVEVAGETVGGAVLGKFVSGASRLLPRVLGRKYSVDEALAQLRNPNFVREFAKDTLKVATVESGTEATQNAAEAAIERDAGIADGDPWAAATASLGPTLALTVPLGPVAGMATRARMRANQKALAVIADPTADVQDVYRASAELAPQMEALAGKDAVNKWRLDLLYAALWARGERETLNEIEANKALAEMEAKRNPPIPTVPPDVMIGRKPVAPQYASPEEAQSVWDTFASKFGDWARAAADKTAEELDAKTFSEFAASVPAGVPTFAQYAADVKKARSGPLAAGGRITERGLKFGYVQAVNNMLRQIGQQEAAITPAEAAQPQLDLDHPNAAPVRTQTERGPLEPPPTAMAQALERAGARKAVEEQAARKQNEQAVAAREAEAAALRENQIEGLAQTADRTRRVEAANKLADAAEAGKITRNTPVTREDLTKAWAQAAAEHGLGVDALRGQARAKLNKVLDRAASEKVWMRQLKVLQDARDAMGQGVTRDSLDAMITKLQSEAPTLPQEAAQPTKEVSDVARQFTDPLLPERERDAAPQPVQERQDAGQDAGRQGQDALLTPATSAPPVGSAASPFPLLDVARPVVAPTAAPIPAPESRPPKPAPRPPKEPAKPTKPSPAVTISREGAEVPWGAFDATPPEGEVSYATPGFFSKPEERVGEPKKRTLSTRVPDRDKRPGMREHETFYFEHYHFDPSKPRSYNVRWVIDYRRARAMAEGIPVDDNGKPLTTKNAKVSLKDRANAQSALQWLQEYEGSDILKLADQRVAELDAIYDTNARAREHIAAVRKSIYDSYAAALRAKRAQEKGVPESRVKFDAKDEALLQQMVKNDPGVEYLQAELPNYSYSDTLAQALDTGKTDRVLAELEARGPTEWVRYMAGVLRRLGLQTKVARSNSVAYDADNPKARVYGRYHHASDTARFYLGGENAHTVLHEITHAGTVGRIQFALDALRVSPLARTADQRAAVAALGELRALMNELRGRDTRRQYAFKNEMEFVAEVFSNERFQRWLNGQEANGRTMWQRVVNWVRGLLGMHELNSVNALDRAITISTPFIGASRFGHMRGLSFNHSATGAAAQTDGYGEALVGKWQQFARSHPNIGTAPERLRQGLLALSTTFHLTQTAAKDKTLSPIVEGMRGFMSADDQKTVMRQAALMELSAIPKMVKLAIAKLPLAQQRAMDAKLMELAGEASRWRIDLHKNFDDNKRGNKELDDSLREHVNKLHREYSQLDPTLRRALDDSVKLFRKYYIKQSALTLSTVLRTYRASHHAIVDPVIRLLDIQQPALSEGANSKPEYYADAYSENLDKVLRKIFGGIRTMLSGQEGSQLAADVNEIEKFYNAAVSNPYQHLGRSGDHFLEFDVADNPAAWNAITQALEPFGKVIGAPNEKRHIFMRFENAAQRQEAERAVRAVSASVVPNTIRGGTLYELADQNAQGLGRVMHEALRRVDEQFAGTEKKEMNQFLKRMLLDMYPETSPRKALSPRKGGGVPGYDASFVRNFSKRAEGVAVMLSNGYTLPLYDKAFGQIKEQIDKMRGESSDAAAAANDVFGELNKRFSNSLHPVDSPVIDKVKAVGYNFYLAVSPAFMLMNMMQPYHLTLPYLGGRYGFVGTAREMARSTSKALKLMSASVKGGWQEGVAKGGVQGGIAGVLDLTLPLEQSALNDGERAAIKRLLASGQLDTTQSHELGQLASGQSQAWTTTMKLLSTGSHYTEVVNRLTTALAAYNLERARGGSQFDAESRAIEAVRATQYDYSDHNTASALGRHGAVGKVTPLLASFQQYAFQTMELLWRMARDTVQGTPEEKAIAWKQLGGVMTTTSMLAGTLGLPLANVVARVVDAMLGSDDDPSDVKVAYRQWLAEVFGNDVAEAIARGIPRAVLGFDTSARAGMQDILPGSRFMADRRTFKDKLESGALDMLGPAVSAGADMAVGLNKIADGQLMDGLIQMTPLAIRGPLKAAQMTNIGYTTATGNQLPMEVTPWATIVQSAGFSPSVKAEQSEVNFAFRQRDALLKQRKTVLTNKLYRIMEEGGDTTSALRDIAEFNATNPQYAIEVGSGLRARAKARAVAEASGTGIATTPRYLPTLDRYSYANTK